MGVQTNMGGTGQLTIDGAAQSLGASLTINFGGRVRTPKEGISGTAGNTQKWKTGTLDVEIYDSGTVSTAYLQSITSSTLLFANDNGKTTVFTGCAQIEEISANPVEATMKVKFSYQNYTEQPA